MNSQIQAEQDIKTYHKVKAIRRMVIEEFLEELKDKMNRMTYNDDGPRDAGKGVVYQCEDRGYHHGIAQVQCLISELRAKL